MKREDMSFLLHFLTLFLAVGVCLGKYFKCPRPEDISPCTCGLDEFRIKTEVVCNRVDDVAKVRRALQSLRGIQGVSVTFNDCNLGQVPSDLFKGLHVTWLCFFDCNLEGFGNEGRSALEGLEDIVQTFQLNNGFSKSNAPRFLNVSGLHKIRYLTLDSNNIAELGNEWFAGGPANVETLSVQANGIGRMGDRAFSQLKKIQLLWLGNNRVGNPKRTMFPSPAADLSMIDLSNNQISNLPVDLFSDMPALKYVYLNGNVLQHIPKGTWTIVWSQLDFVRLEDNPLDCDFQIEWTFTERRPKDLRGTCEAPPERKGLDLKEVIDDNRQEVIV